jgi:phosphate-selective porin OprO/OprP
MKLGKLPVALTAIGAITLSQNVFALTMEQRMEAMERKMSQMQSKLEQTETENRQLKTQLKQGTATQSVSQRAADIKNVDDKVVVLQKELEAEKKVTAEATKKAPKIDFTPQGIGFASSDGNFKVNLGGFLHMDNRYFMGTDPGAGFDQFLIRRARLTIGGSVYKNVDYRFNIDFAGSQTRLFDAFADFHYFVPASVMIGKFRQPLSLERYQTANNITFAERAYPAMMAPNRDVGVMLHGTFAKPGYKAQYAVLPQFKDFFLYEVGVFNGIRDNQPVQNSDLDKDNNKEIAARMFMHPFIHTDSVFEGLGFGVAGTWGQPNNNTLYSFTSPGQQTIYTYNTAATALGTQYRVYPQMYWYWKSFGMMGEYYTTTLGINAVNAGKQINVDQSNSAWQINMSYVLTGEKNSFFAIKPGRPVNLADGSWGAFQAVARYQEMHLDNATFNNFGTAKTPFYLVNPANSVGQAQSWGVGLNWIMNDHVRIMTNYDQSYFTGGAADNLGKIINRQMEKVIISRVQVQF